MKEDGISKSVPGLRLRVSGESSRTKAPNFFEATGIRFFSTPLKSAGLFMLDRHRNEEGRELGKG